jgi:hypothetical protein
LGISFADVQMKKFARRISFADIQTEKLAWVHFKLSQPSLRTRRVKQSRKHGVWIASGFALAMTDATL